MQPVLIPFGAPNLYFRDLCQISLVVDAVAQDVAEISQRPLQRVCSALLFRLFKCSSFAFAILDLSVADVLVMCAIFQCNSYDDRETKRYFARLRVLVDKIDLYVLYGAAPAIEAEDLVRKTDGFFGC